jgi:hypothetical protein
MNELQEFEKRYPEIAQFWQKPESLNEEISPENGPNN